MAFGKAILALAALVAVLTGPVSPARAQERSDQIQAVIADQIEAFRRDDLAAAFAHASPFIQQRFGDPATFGRMVRSGYPMVWRPASWQMLGLGDTARGLVQKVMFVDRAGKAWEADYQMIQVEGRWRINGVWLKALPGISS